MARSILQADDPAKLDSVGAGEAQSAGASADPTLVDGSSEDTGAAFVIGDPDLASGLEGIAPSGGTGGATGSAVQLSGSLAEVVVVGGGAASTDSIGPGSADTPILGNGGAAPAGAATAAGDWVTAGGLASGTVDGVVTGGGSSAATTGSTSTTTGATSGGIGFDSVTSAVITGSGGLTFDISFDASVSGAPTGFDAGVESAFQDYADTFKGSAATLYFSVGYGEVNGSALFSGNLGESFTFFGATETYATLSSTMSARAAALGDAAVSAAVANDLPATDPTGGKTLDMASAEEKALGLLPGSAGSFASPDGDIGFSSSFSFDYTPGLTPPTGTYDFLGVVEHEIAEVMGRNSWLTLSGTTDYSAMDLFRFSSSGGHQFTSGNPSYFSLDAGNTDLYNWNNPVTGNPGDLGDWAATNPYTPDSYNDNSSAGVLNPVTSRDTTLMDVLGWSRVTSTTYTVGGGQTSSGIIVYSGDQELVQSGGVAVATYALTGGIEVVSSGGTTTGTTLNGGTLELFGGAVVSGGITFSGSGGQLQIGGTTMPGNTISGFKGVGDLIDLTGLTFSGNTSVGFISATDVLTVTEGGNSGTIQLDNESYIGISWSATQDAGSGTDITAACFCRGTRFLTDQGEVAVEELAIGDKVMTISGAARRVKWLGHRAYDRRFVAGNRKVWPIRIEAEALGDGVPARDLWVSPEHALYFGNVLVPAGLLVNGATITEAESIDGIEYFHIELDTHDVILAEGAPAETYVDCDNRGMFHNSREFAALYPGATPPAWEFCAPRVAEGSPELAVIRAALLARAELFHRFTGDPDLHLVVDGRVVRPQSFGHRTLYRFEVPAGSRSVSLWSRTNVPAKVDMSPADGRRLGVAVERIVLRDAGLSKEIGHDSPTLSDGFHEPNGSHRWTDGSGRLPSGWLAAFAGDCILEVHLAETEMRYGLEAPAHKRPDATLQRRSIGARLTG